MIPTGLRWLFAPLVTSHHSPGPSDDPASDPGVRLLALTAALETRIAALEKSSTGLVDMRLQWAEVLDKLQRWTNRQSARDQQKVRRSLEELADSSEDPPGPTISPPGGIDPHQLKNALRQRLRAQNGGVR